MSNYFAINKSGEKVPVYSDTDKSEKIGTIYDREAFGFNANWGGDNYFCNIIFKHSDGSLASGFIIDPPIDSITRCSEYPYGTETINGETYITFLMRSSCAVYTASGNKWGAVAKNCRVACKTALSGDSYPEWKGINYVESSKGGWVAVTGDNVDYGFVDTGLGIASGYHSIPMYGSW